MAWRKYVQQRLTILIRRRSLHGKGRFSSQKFIFQNDTHHCSTHALHLIADEIRGQFNTVDELISNMKKIFRKAPYRVALFKSIAQGIRLLPEPILTCWGTWLEAAIYYCENFQIISSVINVLDENDADSIKKVKLCLLKPGLENNLAYIKSNFQVLTMAI
jgi:hypothetical protein